MTTYIHDPLEYRFGMDELIVEVNLTEEDIPGAKLDQPLEKYAIPELKWWLLCSLARHTPQSKGKRGLVTARTASCTSDKILSRPIRFEI